MHVKELRRFGQGSYIQKDIKKKKWLIAIRSSLRHERMGEAKRLGLHNGFCCAGIRVNYSARSG